jgi:hypothetical protein
MRNAAGEHAMEKHVNEDARGFLILGFPRSGTSLLARLLDGHPQISAPPETGLFSAAGRFLSEQSAVEGPPIGVLTGLAFAGLAAEEVMAPLREMIFAFHRRIADGKPIWCEKTGTDIFHIETLEPLVADHMRFICLIRHPLDVIASNLELMATMGAQLPELFALTRGINSPVEGLARAWLERNEALDAFVSRHEERCLVLRYEDLLERPAEEFGRLLAFMNLEGEAEAVIAAAFASPGRIGLGDFRIHETTGLRPPAKDGWRKRLPRAAPARVLPLLAPLMERHGYPVPKMPRLPSREEAVRQFTMAMAMKRNAASGT